MAQLYRQKVDGLVQALQEPDTRIEASEILRGLVDEIILTPTGAAPVYQRGRRANGASDSGHLQIELRGNLAAMMPAAANAKGHRKVVHSRDTPRPGCAIQRACAAIVIASFVLMATTSVSLVPEATPTIALGVLAAIGSVALAIERVRPWPSSLVGRAWAAVALRALMTGINERCFVRRAGRERSR